MDANRAEVKRTCCTKCYIVKQMFDVGCESAASHVVLEFAYDFDNAIHFEMNAPICELALVPLF